MKKLIYLIIISLAISTLSSCRVKKGEIQLSIQQDSTKLRENEKMHIILKKGKAHNYPSFVIWTEDMEGNYLETLFITESYASGIFSYAMYGDSIWQKGPGPSFQPAALPYWSYKKGKINKQDYVPTADNPYLDAYSGATPMGNLDFQTSVSYNKPYRILLEVNQTWDWNKYWTNNKYPESNAYKRSAQPSLVYAVTINEEHQAFFLHPIGHGDPKGESGKLFTDLRSFTTALEIFSSITIEIE